MALDRNCCALQAKYDVVVEDVEHEEEEESEEEEEIEREEEHDAAEVADGKRRKRFVLFSFFIVFLEWSEVVVGMSKITCCGIDILLGVSVSSGARVWLEESSTGVVPDEDRGAR